MPTTQQKPTREEVKKELKREISMRKRVYPGWVSGGKLKQETATHRIECLERALELLDDSGEQGSLFDS